ncbi:AbrB/MazE/SpoVT family DNA-binding domain-containing protein [Loigolactobacillus bifermentans]|jgi:antitoxin PrlF|uniref:AbrB/MazE/SpoVT family DNA-binding domain-containing protein n=1 Tax=Loigolactobacillus bifermentans TaxID=1607 RepID=UPI00070901D7|nr:hypothetical protein [Loigolactobacillus bifermentans]QGG60832.1 AbrB family transcriptional regulator [Loigolactobacillus bifermentans]
MKTLAKVTAQMTTKNQITVPKEVRQALKLREHEQLEFVITTEGVQVKRKPLTQDNLWEIVAEQTAKYGSYATDEVDWGSDVGAEVFEE